MNAKVGGHYFNSVLAGNEARKNGADEALLLDHRGLVAEGAGQNIFLVQKPHDSDNAVLYTPNLGNILPGITRDCVIKLAKQEMGIKTVEANIRPHRLVIPQTQELFFCGTAVEICPIVKVCGIEIENGEAGPVSLALKELYQKVVRGEIDRYNYWLDYVE